MALQYSASKGLMSENNGLPTPTIDYRRDKTYSAYMKNETVRHLAPALAISAALAGAGCDYSKESSVRRTETEVQECLNKMVYAGNGVYSMRCDVYHTKFAIAKFIETHPDLEIVSVSTDTPYVPNTNTTIITRPKKS